MSFGYRDRVNRDKPRLSDRFRGKSGEEIVEELRKDFAKRKQMFFDTAPRSPDFMKPGFPFDDTSRWRSRGDSDLRDRLDEIAQRYPQFATQLRDWTTDEESPSGMGWGSKQAQSQPTAPQQAPSQTEAPTTTTQQPAPPTQTGPDGDVRTQRAMSAPPDNRAKDQPQRFVSRLEINPNSTPVETTHQQPPQPSQPANQPPQPQDQPQPQQAAQPEPKKKPSNVRHIPIFVEDRNETVMPRADVDSTTADFGTTFGSPPRDRDSRDREDGFHGPAYAKYAPPTFGFMNKPKWRYQNTSPFMSRDPMHGSPPQQHHFPHQQQQQHPQYHQPHHSQQQPPHSQQQPHHPQQQPPHPQQQPPHPQQQPHPQQAQPEPPRQQTPPRQPPAPKDPLQEVAAVQKDVDELMKQVEAFTGTRQDKLYIYLDEMLTRNLLKLDLVETEGKENVRAARKETIKCIQKGISTLESKTMTAEEIAAREKAMEVDTEPAEAQPMEVSSGGDDSQETQASGAADSAAPVVSSTPAPEVASEPTATPAPTPEAVSAPMDTSSAPAEATPTESTDSNPSTTKNPETQAPPVATPESTATPPANNPPAEAVAPAAAS